MLRLKLLALEFRNYVSQKLPAARRSFQSYCIIGFNRIWGWKGLAYPAARLAFEQLVGGLVGSELPKVVQRQLQTRVGKRNTAGYAGSS